MNVVPHDDRFQARIGSIQITARPEQTAWLTVSDPNGGEIAVELTRERIEALGKALEEAWDVSTRWGQVRDLRTVAAVAAAAKLREAEKQGRVMRWNRS